MEAYIYQADIYCEDCGKDLAQSFILARQTSLAIPTNSDAFPQGPYPDGGGEADCPQHCGSCGVFLENPLTDDGQEYVRKILDDLFGFNPVHHTIRAEWKAFYDYL